MSESKKYTLQDKFVYHSFLGISLVSFFLFALIYANNSNIITFLTMVFTYTVIFQNLFLIKKWHTQGDSVLTKEYPVNQVEFNFCEIIAFLMPVWLYSGESEIVLFFTLLGLKLLQRGFILRCHIRQKKP